jgi:coproporphyrinogen III oxidase-like Fe-S oxidoreductase
MAHLLEHHSVDIDQLVQDSLLPRSLVMEMCQELVARNMAVIEVHKTSKHVIVDWVVLFLMLDQTTDYDSLKSLFEKEFLHTNLKILAKRDWIKLDKKNRTITAKLEMLSDTMRMALADFEEDRATRA